MSAAGRVQARIRNAVRAALGCFAASGSGFLIAVIRGLRRSSTCFGRWVARVFEGDRRIESGNRRVQMARRGGRVEGPEENVTMISYWVLLRLEIVVEA